MGSGRAMILPSSPNHLAPSKEEQKEKKKCQKDTPEEDGGGEACRQTHLLHFQNAVLQNVLVGGRHGRPLAHVKTLILQIARPHVLGEFH